MIEYVVKVSFMEIYMEKIRDLLARVYTSITNESGSRQFANPGRPDEGCACKGAL